LRKVGVGRYMTAFVYTLPHKLKLTRCIFSEHEMLDVSWNEIVWLAMAIIALERLSGNLKSPLAFF
jgi:hypothetical protein